MSTPNNPAILAIDIGTSAIKASFYDAAANSVEGSLVSIPHDQITASDGTVEEPVERIVTAVEAAIDHSLEFAANSGLKIAGVAMDSMASTILAVDDSGDPVTPVYTYADTRSADDVEALRRELDEAEVHQRTGAMQHTSYVPGRARWLKRTRPAMFDRAARWLDVSTYLHSRWFGAKDVVASYSVASWSGMLNRHLLCWDDEVVQAAGLTSDALPELGSYSDSQTGLRTEFASRWPAIADVPFFPAVGDGAAVNIGTGCAGPDRVALSVGTTSAMRVLRQKDDYEIPRGLWSYCLGADLALTGGAFSEGGLLLDWASKTLQIPPVDQLDSALADREPGAHGLTILPFLAGERATGWSTRATGVFEGIRSATSPLDLVQGMMEAVSLRFSLVADLLVPDRSSDLVFVASGSAIRNSRWWLQIMADALDAPVVINAEEQETGRGAAILALHSLGLLDSLSQPEVEVSETYEPRPAASAVLREQLQRQVELYSRTLGEAGN